ncbi:homoserine dehydrogenase [Sporobacter termitidis DSM 10068]|uniref:Homoserine dehydrogenase n=1 Tax=Sporobacter termitidis DSM 10068 TaxID=1123282 RepID=A0A1M5Y2Q7_9FIRM|nr:homoserine dehydrogenase [Sporobacter termitidis]SHI06292.1 homoserine dehydrogenase [Sporobacter termitidis DSM 10068]
MFDIAILGFGTVGSGVMEVIEKNSDMISQSAAQEIRVKYIVDVRDFTGNPYESLIVKDFSVVENDPDVKVVVETIGGAGVAYDFTRRSLLKGKSVVTSNKELVATHGYELTQIAREKGVNYLFEASVGGGIPIIRPITQCLAANKINEIYGILNGTTNYILTEMVKNGVAFANALREAQEKGYAEQNPDADIKGHDVCRKICILSALCFGRHVYPQHVETEGIEAVTLDDISYAGRIGYRVKLLGRAIHMEGDKIAVYVAPHLVREDNLIASVEGVMNGIIVRGNAIGDVMFYGAGAGKLPTASAVVADIIDAAKHVNARKWLSWQDGGPELIYDVGLLESAWYVRASDAPEKIRRVFGDVTVIDGLKDGETAFTTPVMSKNKADSLLKELSVLSVFRIID